GIVCGGWPMARAALIAQQRLAEGKGDKSFYEGKIKTARFYADHLLTQAPGLRNAIVHGAVGVMALTEEQF
ncbi:MAG TPA: acyl-CoA dehydrogenase C-terminal domain-containing protein, partial [Burkholderiales bacterium]|nr:acyl-CoA dehydrogenase C-terminal domain-containing protein [Burkholderiales bacterium]